MITIQDVHAYLKLVDLGIAKPVTCVKDVTHMQMICSLNEKDQIEFYCLDCSTRLKPGFAMLEQMFDTVQEFKNSN